MPEEETVEWEHVAMERYQQGTANFSQILRIIKQSPPERISPFEKPTPIKDAPEWTYEQTPQTKQTVIEEKESISKLITSVFAVPKRKIKESPYAELLDDYVPPEIEEMLSQYDTRTPASPSPRGSSNPASQKSYDELLDDDPELDQFLSQVDLTSIQRYKR